MHKQIYNHAWLLMTQGVSSILSLFMACISIFMLAPIYCGLTWFFCLMNFFLLKSHWKGINAILSYAMTALGIYLSSEPFTQGKMYTGYLYITCSILNLTSAAILASVAPPLSVSWRYIKKHFHRK